MYTPLVRHWRRGDSDRLYVTTTTGRQLGWFDLVTETLHSATEGIRPMLWRVVTDFRLGRRPVLPAADDLATHQAGMWELERAFRCVDESPVFCAASDICGERDERAEWTTAAEAAEQVAESLTLLPGAWSVLHSVPSGRVGERLDHVAIGPAGVVVVLSEHVSGQVVAGGDAVEFEGVRHKIVPHLSKLADHVVTRVRERVPVHVVVVVHGGTVVRRTPLSDPRVLVSGAAELPDLVNTLPTPVDDAVRQRLHDRLRRRTAWAPRSRGTAPAAGGLTVELAGLQLLDGLPRFGDLPSAPKAEVATVEVAPVEVVDAAPADAAPVVVTPAPQTVPPARRRRVPLALPPAA